MKAWLRFGAVCALGVLNWACAAEFDLPADGSNVIGADQHTTTRYSDTLVDLARLYSIGYEEIGRANRGVDMWLPGAGTHILVPGRHILPPGPRAGIVINLPEHRMYYYPKVKEGQTPVVLTFPVNVGRLGRSSPLGVTRVIAKEVRPSWYPTASIRKEHLANGDPLPAVVPPGPKNPLGKLALRLGAGKGTYLIHGTNTPWAIGMEITHGCISMYPEDVARLFPRVAIGTPVWVINAPVKVAYVDDTLLVEAHPPVTREGQPAAPDVGLLARNLEIEAGEHAAMIQWDLARKVLEEATGVPTAVSAPEGMRSTAADPQAADR